MRISDWSSDVCSSDLAKARNDHYIDFRMSEKPEQVLIEYWIAPACRIKKRGIEVAISQQHCDGRRKNRQCEQQHEGCHQNGPDEQRHLVERHARRSEEHTSELQSLMRISYAVFCLK